MNALRGRAAVVAGNLAAFAGHCVRISRGLPGLAGAGLISYGAGMVYAPAGVIVAGVFCLLIDWRL